MSGQGDARWPGRAVEGEDATDALYQGATGPFDDRPRQRLPGLSSSSLYADLDELVMVQRLFELGQDGRGETGVADRDDDLAVMGQGAETTALGMREFHGRQSLPQISAPAIGARGRDDVVARR